MPVYTIANLSPTAAQATLVSAGLIARLDPFTRATLQAVFTYGSGGTSIDAYVQSSLDGGSTWFDVANFHFTTSNATAGFNLQSDTSVTSQATLTNGAMSANTCQDGLLGIGLQVFWQSVGTYADTSLVITAETVP